MAKSKAKAPPWRDRVLRLERVRAGDLAGNPQNWRRHPPAQVEALKGVLSEVGFAGALLAYQDGGKLTLIDGHLRAGLDPEAEVPVLVLDVDRGEARKLLATYDPLAAMAAPDQDALLALLETVSSESQAVKDMLEALANGSYAPLMPMPNMEPKGLTDPDDVPEMPAESWVKRGDLFQLGEHRLICGDSTLEADVNEILGNAKARLCITSPPYWLGKEYETQMTRQEIESFQQSVSAILAHAVNPNEGRIILNIGTYWKSRFDGGRPHFGLGLDEWIPKLEKHHWLLRHCRIWAKRGALPWTDPISDLVDTHWEFIATFYNPSYKYRGQQRCGEPWAQQGIWDDIHGAMSESGHVAAYPVEIPYRNLVLYSIPGELCIDPFLGSGTTLIACEKLGRICYGMEIEPAYVQVAIERWQNYTGQKVTKINDGDGHQD